MSTKCVPTLSQASEFWLWHSQLKAYLQSKGLFAYMTEQKILTEGKLQLDQGVCVWWSLRVHRQDDHDARREKDSVSLLPHAQQLSHI
jgi:hypothetical protein